MAVVRVVNECEVDDEDAQVEMDKSWRGGDDGGGGGGGADKADKGSSRLLVSGRGTRLWPRSTLQLAGCRGTSERMNLTKSLHFFRFLLASLQTISNQRPSFFNVPIMYSHDAQSSPFSHPPPDISPPKHRVLKSRATSPSLARLTYAYIALPQTHHFSRHRTTAHRPGQPFSELRIYVVVRTDLHDIALICRIQNNHVSPSHPASQVG